MTCLFMQVFLERIGKHLNATSFVLFTTNISAIGDSKFFNALKSLSKQVVDETIAFDAVIFSVKLKVGFLSVITTNLKPALV